MRMWVVGLLLSVLVQAQDVRQEEVLQAMRKAAEFYRNKVSTEGGYHFYYAADLSYGRSESAEGPTQVEVQREATPVVALAYLHAFDSTGDRFYLESAQAAAQALVRGQLCSGGWDYLIEFDPQKRRDYEYRSDGNCGENKKGVTNLDDNVSQGALRVLMRVDRALAFSDQKIHEAALYALDKLVGAQYANGAWPQRFRQPPDSAKSPIKQASYPEAWSKTWPGPDYQLHYTFNDNSMSDVVDLMLEAARIYKQPRYREAAEKCGNFFLMAQMPEPQPAWAQQYDANMHPAWARVFEPPSVSGGESQGIMRTLMVLYRETGNKKYLEPIPRALAYLKKSFVERTSAEVFSRIPASEPVLARFYELKTNRPLYITKGSRINAAGLGAKMLDGYQISYSPDSVITHYGVLVSGKDIQAIEAEYADLAAADPKKIARPEKLSGLSPWSEHAKANRDASRQAVGVRQILSSMDGRGAWTKEGVIGKADRVVFVFAAQDMLLRVGRGPSDGAARGGNDPGGRLIQLKEGDTVEVFSGTQPPREQIISSGDFARHLMQLADYAAAVR